jgi:hypothetical protein
MTDLPKAFSVDYQDYCGFYAVSDTSGDAFKGDIAFHNRIAKLMAASPELLETVKDCLAILLGCGLGHTFEANRCRSVIVLVEASRTLTIETTVPLWPVKRGRWQSELSCAIRALKIDESVFVPHELVKRHPAKRIYQIKQTPGQQLKNFTTRKEKDGFRIWRIA